MNEMKQTKSSNGNRPPQLPANKRKRKQHAQDTTQVTKRKRVTEKPEQRVKGKKTAANKSSNKPKKPVVLENKEINQVKKKRKPARPTNTNTSSSNKAVSSKNSKKSPAAQPRKKKPAPQRTVSTQSATVKKKDGLTQKNATKMPKNNTDQSVQKQRPNPNKKIASKNKRNTQPKNTQAKPSGKGLKVLYYFICTVVMLLLLGFSSLYMAYQMNLSVLGHRVVRLQDNGMMTQTSGLRTRDLVIVKEQTLMETAMNEVIVLQRAQVPVYTARRLVAIESAEDQTQELRVVGDAQPFEEESVAADSFVGIVATSIRNLADLFRFIDYNLFLSLVFCVSLITLFILLGVYLFS